MASSRQARRMRTAISPRLAIRIFLNMQGIECSGILACTWFVNLRHFTCVSNRLRYNGYLQWGNVAAHGEVNMPLIPKPKWMRTGVILLFFSVLLLFTGAQPRAQQPVITPPESIIAENISNIPASLAETAGRYGAYRSATLSDWNPEK